MFVLYNYNEAPQYYGPVWEGHYMSKQQGVLSEVAVAKGAYHTPLQSCVNQLFFVKILQDDEHGFASFYAFSHPQVIQTSV